MYLVAFNAGHFELYAAIVEQQQVAVDHIVQLLQLNQNVQFPFLLALLVLLDLGERFFSLFRGGSGKGK